jgi:hypothetical protein
MSSDGSTRAEFSVPRDLVRVVGGDAGVLRGAAVLPQESQRLRSGNVENVKRRASGHRLTE